MIRKFLFSLIPQGTFVASLILGFLMDRYLPVAYIVPPVFRPLGWVFISAGVLLAVSAMGLIFLRHTTPIPGGRPSVFITDGPFSFSRNPAYLSDVLVATGVAVLLSSLGAFLAPVCTFLIIDRVVIPVEEQALRQAFGEEFEKYSRSVRRWI